MARGPLASGRKGWLAAAASGLSIVLVAGLIALVAGFWIYSAPGPSAGATVALLRKGSGVTEIGAELQRVGAVRSGALFAAAAQVTGERGDDLKRRLRTGTVLTYDDRNWELRWAQERPLINLSRAVAVDMESGTIAAQGYRLRVPYGTLLCVSDKPLHSEIKLPGAANAFYNRAVSQHLKIGIAALDLLRTELHSLHSRKLRSFDEPPFR